MSEEGWTLEKLKSLSATLLKYRRVPVDGGYWAFIPMPFGNHRKRRMRKKHYKKWSMFWGLCGIPFKEMERRLHDKLPFFNYGEDAQRTMPPS